MIKNNYGIKKRKIRIINAGDKNKFIRFKGSKIKLNNSNYNRIQNIIQNNYVQIKGEKTKTKDEIKDDIRNTRNYINDLQRHYQHGETEKNIKIKNLELELEKYKSESPDKIKELQNEINIIRRQPAIQFPDRLGVVIGSADEEIKRENVELKNRIENMKDDIADIEIQNTRNMNKLLKTYEEKGEEIKKEREMYETKLKKSRVEKELLISKMPKNKIPVPLPQPEEQKEQKKQALLTNVEIPPENKISKEQKFKNVRKSYLLALEDEKTAPEELQITPLKSNEFAKPISRETSTINVETSTHAETKLEERKQGEQPEKLKSDVANVEEIEVEEYPVMESGQFKILMNTVFERVKISISENKKLALQGLATTFDKFPDQIRNYIESKRQEDDRYTELRRALIRGIKRKHPDVKDPEAYYLNETKIIKKAFGVNNDPDTDDGLTNIEIENIMRHYQHVGWVGVYMCDHLDELFEKVKNLKNKNWYAIINTSTDKTNLKNTSHWVALSYNRHSIMLFNSLGDHYGEDHLMEKIKEFVHDLPYLVKLKKNTNVVQGRKYSDKDKNWCGWYCILHILLLMCHVPFEYASFYKKYNKNIKDFVECFKNENKFGYI